MCRTSVCCFSFVMVITKLCYNAYHIFCVTYMELLLKLEYIGILIQAVIKMEKLQYQGSHDMRGKGNVQLLIILH